MYEQQWGICQLSGFSFPMGELVKDWQGLLVHRRYADKRNPQDFVRAKPEAIPPRSSPEPDDVFITTPVTAADL